MIIAAATAAEAIILLTTLAASAELPLITAEAAKALIIKFGLQTAFKHLLARCEDKIADQQRKEPKDA